MNEPGHVRPDYGPDPVQGRTPPQNVELEMCVLGAIMLEPKEAYPLVSNILTRQDFYLEGHALLFDIMGELHKRGIPPDSVAVLDAVRARAATQQIGGGGVIMGMLNSVPTAASVEYHARIVADKAKRRQIIRSATRMVDAAHNPDLPLDDLASMYQEFAILAGEGRGDNEARPVNDIMRDYWDGLGERLHEAQTLIEAGKKPEPYGIRTGIPHLDNLWRGLRPSRAYLIAARPTQGKSALLAQIAVSVAKQGIPVLIFSLEMGDLEIGERMLCMETRRGNDGYSSDQMDRPWQFSDPDWQQISQAYGRVAGLPLYIISDGDITPEKFKSLCRTLTLKHKLGLICHDYLQIMANPRGLPTFEIVTQSALAIQSVKQTLKLPVIAACQLNTVEARNPYHKPDMADLRDSGYIGQMADVATFIWHDPEDFDKNACPGKAELIVRKSRGGQRGTCAAWWYNRLTQFAERAQDDGEAVRVSTPTYQGKMTVRKTNDGSKNQQS